MKPGDIVSYGAERGWYTGLYKVLRQVESDLGVFYALRWMEGEVERAAWQAPVVRDVDIERGFAKLVCAATPREPAAE